MTLRAKVFARDRGICRLCKRDTELLIQTAMHEDGCTRREAIKALGEYWGFGWSVKTLWICDHKHPKALGGADEADQCQTLCLLCNREKTSKQDLPAIAKMRRKRAKHERHVAAMKAKVAK